ncbi:MAG: N-acetylmuramoyl-L-alanine amidase [Clostridia bacterium]|nr:N-acetylmuramoyl-L-alanine amidase [Clostridia bacterium]
MRKKGRFAIKTVKLTTVIVVVAALVFSVAAIAIGATWSEEVPASSPQKRIKVVLDAGHGGIDAGVVGQNGTKESDFNLAMTFVLKDLLTQSGCLVVLTRSDENGLYGDVDKNFKRADMKKRKEIVQSADPDILISVHANKYPSSDRRGAQVFFDDFCPAGRDLAASIQDQFNTLNARHVGRTYSALAGDYYMLKLTRAPSVIVECGFLSNPEDEALLNDENYRRQLAEAIACGVKEYLSNQ